MVGFVGEPRPVDVGVKSLAPKDNSENLSLNVRVICLTYEIAFVANAIGLPACIKTAPIPLPDASTWITVSAPGLK